MFVNFFFLEKVKFLHIDVIWCKATEQYLHFWDFVVCLS